MTANEPRPITRTIGRRSGDVRRGGEHPGHEGRCTQHRQENVDRTPSQHWPSPVIAGEIPGDRGPVMVTVECRVDPAQSPEFAKALELCVRGRPVRSPCARGRPGSPPARARRGAISRAKRLQSDRRGSGRAEQGDRRLGLVRGSAGHARQPHQGAPPLRKSFAISMRSPSEGERKAQVLAWGSPPSLPCRLRPQLRSGKKNFRGRNWLGIKPLSLQIS
jgi:hypothetical protein